MNEVQQAVIDYVRTPQTDYALLITGPWGCGKTYFWKHVVEAQLRQSRPGDARLRAKDIDTQLFLASHPHLKKKWAARLTSTGGTIVNQLLKAFTRFELPAIDLRWLINTKNAVLCFDDLERTRLSMKEALGYINTFVEHERVKVIILCNEEAISDEDDKKTYGAMKEKIVGASLAFRPELDAVFRTLIDEYQSRDAFHGFLSKNAELLRQLFDRSETRNIRSLRRALSALAVIFDALSASGIDPNAVAKQLIYAVAPASFELHGRGADPEELREVLSADNMAIAGWVAMSRRKDGDSEVTWGAEFAERYFEGISLTDWRIPVGCPPICEFLLTGMLDRAALTSWAKELTKPPDEREQRFKQLTADPRDMEDEEFASATKSTMDELESGQIGDIGTYWGLYRAFEWLCDSGLVAITREGLLKKFSDGLRKAREGGGLKPEPRLRSAIDHPGLAPTSDEGRSLCQRLLETNEALLRGAMSERVRALVSSLQDDPETFIHALSDDGEDGLLFTPVFQELPVDEVTARILDFPNNLKVRFGWAVQARYEKRAPSSEFVVELPALAKIRDALNKQVEATNGSPVPMSLHIVRNIVGTLDHVIERLKQVDPKESAAVAGPAENEPEKENRGDENDSTETAELA